MPKNHPASSPVALLLSAGALLCAGCDNVGRAFDNNVTPTNPGTGASPSTIQVVPIGGDARDGIPTVKATFPADNGWPLTVPIVVEFSESVNESSILPTTTAGADGHVVLRVQGSTQPLPCQYDLLAGGRLLVMRPVQPLSNAQNPTYEVVLLQDARDVDGVRFNVPTDGTVLTTFQVNQADTIHDGRILTTFPRDNGKEVPRETPYLVVFDRPAVAATVVEANLFLRPQGGLGLAAGLSFPLQTVGVDDPRVVLVEPTDPLAAATNYQLVVNDSITFGNDGTLDFSGRTPFAVFRTTGPAAPTLVELGNPTTGFPNKINRDRTADAVLHVTTPADALTGDKVRARIYGGDARTTPVGDLAYVERSTTLTSDGQQVVTVDFAGTLGTLTGPRFDDGSITFTAQMRRGSQASGFVHKAADAAPLYDISQPTLVTAGPPTGAATTDLVSDLQWVAYYGTASEALAQATLHSTNPIAGAQETSQFAFGTAGRLMMLPLPVGRQRDPVPYSLTFRDQAGNLGAAEVNGQFVQRGMVTGTLAGTLTVEAYDQTTLQPIQGATVLVDPGVPLLPAVGQQAGTTAANGRVDFTVSAPSHTVTIVRAGYDLITFYDTAAAFVSLPLRPVANATATFRGNLVVAPSPGATAVVGNTAFDDRSPIGVRTSNSAPSTIPDTAIVPNRPQVVSAFGGVIEPTATPPFSALGIPLLGPTFTVPTPPTAPVAAGGVSQPTIPMLPSDGLIASLAGVYDLDFSLALGLDFANLIDGAPVVRATRSLFGFEGQVMVGLGYATANGNGSYTIHANFAQPTIPGFALLGDYAWVVSEARDASGNISRHRAAFGATDGVLLTIPGVMSIPTITAPTNPSTGSPAVTFADVADPGVIPFGLGHACVDVTATDGAGRRWRILHCDQDDASGTDVVQYPDLATAAVAGLQNGDWSVRVETRIWPDRYQTTAADFALTDRIYEEALYARCAAVTFQVQ